MHLNYQCVCCRIASAPSPKGGTIVVQHVSAASRSNPELGVPSGTAQNFLAEHILVPRLKALISYVKSLPGTSVPGYDCAALRSTYNVSSALTRCWALQKTDFIYAHYSRLRANSSAIRHADSKSRVFPFWNKDSSRLVCPTERSRISPPIDARLGQ